MTHSTCILELVIKHKPNAIDYVVIALGFFKGNSPHSCKTITIFSLLLFKHVCPICTLQINCVTLN